MTQNCFHILISSENPAVREGRYPFEQFTLELAEAGRQRTELWPLFQATKKSVETVSLSRSCDDVTKHFPWQVKTKISLSLLKMNSVIWNISLNFVPSSFDCNSHSLGRNTFNSGILLTNLADRRKTSFIQKKTLCVTSKKIRFQRLKKWTVNWWPWEQRPEYFL